MKAIVVSDFVDNPSQLQPSDVPIPTPASDEYLVRITHCSPQHADILHAQGRHQNNNKQKGWCFPPFVLGFDFSGIVESVPPSSTSLSSGDAFRHGDRVFGAHIGAFAEFVAVKPSSIHRVPSGLSLETACAMGGQAVSYAAVVHIAQVQPGETVLVSGASGGLGSVACMVAKAVGARVIALAGDAHKAALMRADMDVDAVLVMDEAASWIEQTLRLTENRGVEVVIDNTGMVNDAIRAVAYFGRIVILGFAARKGVMEQVKMNKLLLKSITVTGYRFGESGRRYPDELARIWDGYLQLLREGRLKPLLYGDYKGLSSVGMALSDLEKRKVYGKVVVSVDTDSSTSKL